MTTTDLVCQWYTINPGKALPGLKVFKALKEKNLSILFRMFLMYTPLFSLQNCLCARHFVPSRLLITKKKKNFTLTGAVKALCFFMGVFESLSQNPPLSAYKNSLIFFLTNFSPRYVVNSYVQSWFIHLDCLRSCSVVFQPL